jgi:hypothetical protein
MTGLRIAALLLGINIGLEVTALSGIMIPDMWRRTVRRRWPRTGTTKLLPAVRRSMLGPISATMQ